MGKVPICPDLVGLYIFNSCSPKLPPDPIFARNGISSEEKFGPLDVFTLLLTYLF